MKTKKQLQLRTLTECALLIALATALSFVKVYQAPLGGSVTLLSTLPIMYLSIRHGVAYGMGGGFVYSLIQLWQGSGNLAYVPTAAGIAGCILLDYIVPFTLLGTAGIFCRKGQNVSLATVLAGVVTATVLRFVCHFVGGAVVWYEITKEGQWNDYVQKVGMWTYSFVYNITYIGPDGAMAIAASVALPALEKALKKAKL
ncbi:MAG: energy-coupled thiamine transporter ThiT [Clostridia bacterium]|nr:energy-coupled thiamine transporter ThiT [Clostridia bacterium]